MKEYSLLKSYKEQPLIWDEMFSSLGIRTSYRNFVSAIEDLSVTEMNHKDELAKKLFMSQGITFTVYNSGEGIEKIFPFDIIPRIIEDLSVTEMNHKDELAKKLFMSQGVTFTVYSSGEGIEKIFPFDIIPRIITAGEWKFIESGITQRLKALNLFLKDVYNEQFIINDGVIPAEMVYSCPHFVREMHRFPVPYDIYVHIAGIDLIRDSDGSFYILEDNLRTPSGVSYMLENREITKRIFPDLLPKNNVRTVTNYPLLLHRI